MGSVRSGACSAGIRWACWKPVGTGPGPPPLRRACARSRPGSTDGALPGLAGIKVAVVEDDPEFRDAVLLPVLAQAGFEPVGMGSALELYRELLAGSYDLVLLDVQLPDDSGFAIAKHLRSLSPAIGIVMLTGLADNADRMRGLEAGVDAYLSKPVELEELVATLRNLARRIGERKTGAGEPATAVAGKAGNAAAPASAWCLDEHGWRICSPGGGEALLTLAERQVMSLLAARPGVPVSREELIGRLTGDTYDFDPHRLDMLIHRLRRKCLQQCGMALPLKTVRGVGYVLAW